MTRTEKAINNVINMPKKTGRAEYIRHLEGKRLTRDEVIKAKCYECVGGEDTEPCTVHICPLTPYCQWNKSSDKA